MNERLVVVHPLQCVAEPAAAVASQHPPVARVEGDADLLAAARRELPEGLASDEAVLAILRRQGATMRVADAVFVPRAMYLNHMHNWGRISVRLARARSDLLTELRLGSWAEPGPVVRLRRTLAVRLPQAITDRLHPAVLAGDTAFWRGARTEATRTEWQRLTATYSVLVYHRLAGETRPGQERIDMLPTAFLRQLRALRAARRTPVDAVRLIAFHRSQTSLPARRVTVLTIDDATHDVVAPLASAAAFRPQLFAVTSAIGDAASWLDGVQLASWDDLRRLAEQGVVLGAHSRTHPRDLRMLPDAELRAEIQGSRQDVADGVRRPPSLFAYPNGLHDRRVQAVVAEAGFALAYSTDPGLNGVGTNPLALRRVSAKAWDTRLSIFWKAYTGCPVPAPWEQWLVRRHAALQRARAAARRR